MEPVDLHTFETLLRLAQDAGCEYVRVGELEIRFPPKVPFIAQPEPRVVNIARDGIAPPMPAPQSDIHKLFRGKMPTLGGE